MSRPPFPQELRMRIRRIIAGLALSLVALQPSARAAEGWFEQVKATATPAQLYRFLYAMPKGGDLHNHLTGAVRSEWFWDAALAEEKRGYVYYTRVRIENCAPYGHDEFGPNKALLLFKDIQGSSYEKLEDSSVRVFNGSPPPHRRAP
jgi:adenosine deaminase CECR1